MKTDKIENLDVGTVMAVIARSQIVVHGHTATHETIVGQLPAGFDEVDVVILEWIDAHVRGVEHLAYPMM
jgi:hypothetical protein